MIPAIGLMIGAYIALRCVEIIGRDPKSFASPSARRTTVGFASAVLLGTIALSLMIMFASYSMSSIFSPAEVHNARRPASELEPSLPPPPDVLERLAFTEAKYTVKKLNPAFDTESVLYDKNSVHNLGSGKFSVVFTASKNRFECPGRPAAMEGRKNAMIK